ncbi:armadillo-type protein [Mycena floridula]|nr:armadillo-type protein [Mycena floridula]
MDSELEKVVQAIAIASDPLQISVHQEALTYLTTLQQNAVETWRLALILFTESTPEGTRKYPPQVRFFALRVLDEFLDNRFEPFDVESFQTLQQALVAYIQSEFVFGSAEASAPFLRNKFSHTLTLFFLCTYVEQWPTFFSDLFTLIRPAESTSQSSFNRHISLLFFHILIEISEEVADQILKASRTHNVVRITRDTRVRDAVRERDALQINDAVLAIVTQGVDAMAHLRKSGSQDSRRELDDAVEVVDWGIRTFGSYVAWIDINLTVTPTTVPLLFTLLADHSLPIRLATCAALNKIVGKGLKEPGDKLQLLKVLSIGQVIDALETKTRAQQSERGSDIDEGEESYRESLGKLLNIFGLELLKLDESQDESIRAEASSYLNQLLPVMLRFMSDEYDDTSSTIFALLQTILSGYKRSRKVSSEPIDASKRSFLTSLLQVILTKMKWEEDADPEDQDEDDNADFDKLRKDLRNFMDSVLVVDQDLVTDAVRVLAMNTISAHRSGVSMKWTDAELGIYMVYIFGEINKSGGKGRAAFCQAPPTDKEKRKGTDYSEFPLTTLGELMFGMVQSGLAAYPHRAVSLQFFETIVRYTDFFKVRKECILPTLEAMIDNRGLHNESSSFRLRLFYLFHRFIKESRNDISPDICATILQGIQDLLAIEIVIPEQDDAETDPLAEAVESSTFDAQLYLYETVGMLCAILPKESEQQATLLLSCVKPLMSDLANCLQVYKAGSQELIPIVHTHHIIMALGNIAKGFPDYPSPIPENFQFPLHDVFSQMAQAILMCLEAMNIFKVVRDSTRFAFARILATAGPHVTQFIPPLMSNLLAQFEPSELADFMNFIGLLVFKLRSDMFPVLDELIGPLSVHISNLLTQPISGTDDLQAHLDTKKAYLTLLNSIMSAKLSGIFVSPRNNPSFEALLNTMQRIAEDVSDPQSQKSAFTFLSRCVATYGQLPQQVQNGAEQEGEALPGFERIIYERLVPAAFQVPAAPDINLKDGQVTVVLHEIANFLQTVGKTRDVEAYNFLASVFLPSQNWPQETALDFTTKLRDLDAKGFRKYFTDFVRSSRSGS